MLAIGLAGMLGVAADLGRAYIVRNELTAFADAAAVLAAYELDGTVAGLNAASAAGSAGPGTNRWDFGTHPVNTVDVRFAETYAGSYQVAALASGGSRFVRVTATINLPLYFLPIVPGLPHSMPIVAAAVAGQGVVDSPGKSADPFSPDAIDAGDPVHFGFIPGQQYDIKWAPLGLRHVPGGKCAGDIAAGQDAAGGADDRGYINVGQGESNDGLHAAIVNNDFGPNPNVPEIGEPIDIVSGNMHVGPALSTRIAQDSDSTSDTYSTYQGNGRRILVLAVNDHTPAGIVAGYAAFFLPDDNPCLSNNIKACCAEYIGPAVLGGKKKAAGAPGKIYAVRLFQ
jgi:hypothetical protein